jgi:hypothetical protein
MTEHLKTFAEAVKALKPTGIIGVSTIAKAFDKEVHAIESHCVCVLI